MALRLVVLAAVVVLGVSVVLAVSRDDPPRSPPVADGPPVEGPRIAAAGDIACDPESSAFDDGQGSGLECRQLATANLVVGKGYAALLILGDIQYEDGAYSKFLASYDPSWGRVKSITKPVPGNHEYETGGAAGYYQVLRLGGR